MQGGGDVEEGRRPLPHARGAAEEVVEQELVVGEGGDTQEDTDLGGGNKRPR